MDIHLDLVGGLAGDMFIAAMLDAFPQHEELVRSALGSLGSFCSVAADLRPYTDDVLCGKQFNVSRVVTAGEGLPSPPGLVPHAHTAPHSHTAWCSIRKALEDSTLEPQVVAHAIGIFQLLADSEAAIHGVAVDDVAFHEVGAWDSIADIVGAAVLVHAVCATRWSFSPIPLGSGRVRTEHGVLPVPAPATARLLLGLPTLDDGIPGERVTPTGAAICRYLVGMSAHLGGPRIDSRVLTSIGVGFGTRKLPGISNHVRVLAFVPTSPAGAAGQTWATREMHVIEFEVDDQSGEDLAVGLDHLRTCEGVLDVIQCPVFGKKGRIMVHVRVLVRQSHLHASIEACFRQTTTIGLRHRSVEGVRLERRTRCIDCDGQVVRVKVVDRPGGRTAKTESDDVVKRGDHSVRAALRTCAESEAIEAISVDRAGIDA